MKVSELNQEIIEEVRDLFNQLAKGFNHPSLVETGGPHRVSVVLRIERIPNIEDLRTQILRNIHEVADTKWYINYLKSCFEVITKEKLVCRLLETKDQANQRIKYKTGNNSEDELNISLSRTSLLLELIQTLEVTIEDVERLQQEHTVVPDLELSPLKLSNGNQRLVLVHELGLIDFLTKKYPDLTVTNLSKILAPLIGVGEEHIRRGISGYSKGVKNDPKTDSAFKEIKGELLKFGIDI